MSKKVLTVGVYDLLHKGHVELFRKAKALGDYLVVAVQDSDYVLRFKPQARLMMTTEDRMYMVAAVRYVDKVVSYTAVDDIVLQVDFDILALGPDQVHEGFQRAIHWCEGHGKQVVIIPRTEGVSSSQIKNTMLKQNPPPMCI